MRRARDQTDSRRMSALVQGGGYLVAFFYDFPVGGSQSISRSGSTKAA